MIGRRPARGKENYSDPGSRAVDVHPWTSCEIAQGTASLSLKFELSARVGEERAHNVSRHDREVQLAVFNTSVRKEEFVDLFEEFGNLLLGEDLVIEHDHRSDHAFAGQIVQLDRAAIFPRFRLDQET